MRRFILYIILFFNILIHSACGGSVEEIGDEIIEDIDTGETANPIEEPQINKSESIFGLSILALQHPNFNCDMFFEAIKGLKSLNIGYLHHTFGFNNECLKRVLNDDRLQTIQVYLVNEVCARNFNCGNYETFGQRTADEMQALAWMQEEMFINIYRFIARNSYSFLMNHMKTDTICYVSPGLESNYTPTAAERVLKPVKEIFGDRCLYVYNPVQEEKVTAFHNFLETHHDFVVPDVPYIAGMDGIELEFDDIFTTYPRKWERFILDAYIDKHKRKADKIYLWHSWFNCIPNGGFQDPRARDCSRPEIYEMIKRHVDIITEYQ